MILIFGIITVLYCGLILSLRYGWKKVPENKPATTDEKMAFSMVIPFRNEAENLPSLLKSISELNYSRTHLEVILVDDDSDDSSVKEIQDFINHHGEISIKILRNIRQTSAPKKDALKTGIKNSCFEHIFTTDADCILPKNLLELYNSYFQKESFSLVAGPVSFANNGQHLNSLLKSFQDLDFMSLQATGAGAFGLKKPFLCNGANLCYKKSDFIEVNGFTGNDSISSGDDVFLLQKFIQNQKKTGYLKNPEAIVFTNYQPSVKSLFQQRIRWAAKTSAYSGIFSKFTGILVLLMNFSLLLCLILVVTGKFPDYLLLAIFIFKFIVDLSLLFPAAKFFRKLKPLNSYWWCSLLYPLFTVLVVFSSITLGYNWKGRNYKR